MCIKSYMEEIMSVKHQIARKELLDLGTKLLKEEYVVGTWGNISVRIKEEELVAITPSGVQYDKMVMDAIPIVDMEGNVIDGDYVPSMELKMHLNIYKHRPDINVIIQSHATYSMAMAMARKPIPAANEILIQIVGGRVECAEFEFPGTDALSQSVVKALGDKNAVLMANHGLVVGAASIGEAFKTMVVCERTAQSTILSQSLGGPVELNEESCEYLKDFYKYTYGQGNKKD